MRMGGHKGVVDRKKINEQALNKGLSQESKSQKNMKRIGLTKRGGREGITALPGYSRAPKARKVHQEKMWSVFVLWL